MFSCTFNVVKALSATFSLGIGAILFTMASCFTLVTKSSLFANCAFCKEKELIIFWRKFLRYLCQLLDIYFIVQRKQHNHLAFKAFACKCARCHILKILLNCVQKKQCCLQCWCFPLFQCSIYMHGKL